MPLSHCKNFLRAIQNFHHQDIIDTERRGAEVDPKSLGRISDKGLLLKPSEIEYITRHYRYLYSNRQDKIALDKKVAHMKRSHVKQQYGEQFGYKPYTSQKTQRLANNKRQSLLINDNAPEKIEDRLIMEKVSLQRKKTIMLEEEEKRRMKDATFKPQISPEKNRYGPLTAKYREKQSKYGN